MAQALKNKTQILQKLNIDRLNEMQIEAESAIKSDSDVVLLSPTGTGKTLAFLLPLVLRLDPAIQQIQALILVPSRELALQIEQVFRQMGSGYKVNALYGGRTGQKDKEEIKHVPAVLIGTPGRIADHMRKEVFDTSYIKTLVLDEFDKSLEVGFESDMKGIIQSLTKLQQRILTSATQRATVPKFVRLNNPISIDYLDARSTQLEIKIVDKVGEGPLDQLISTLDHIGNEPGIVFCNLKTDIQIVSEHLSSLGIEHGCFFGGMEQKDRERVLIKFRNGTYQLIVATDLAARGLDIPELKFIIHYELPPREQEFTHRNGRTARMHASGSAYVILNEQGHKPHFVKEYPVVKLKSKDQVTNSPWSTLFISGGRKDKISKGDIAGLFMKQGGLTKDQLGLIELKVDCAFVGVARDQVDRLLPAVNNVRLKKKKVRVSEI